jgi:hypothetical protein
LLGRGGQGGEPQKTADKQGQAERKTDRHHSGILFISGRVTPRGKQWPKPRVVASNPAQTLKIFDAHPI